MPVIKHSRCSQKLATVTSLCTRGAACLMQQDFKSYWWVPQARHEHRFNRRFSMVKRQRAKLFDLAHHLMHTMHDGEIVSTWPHHGHAETQHLYRPGNIMMHHSQAQSGSTEPLCINYLSNALHVPNQAHNDSRAVCQETDRECKLTVRAGCPDLFGYHRWRGTPSRHHVAHSADLAECTLTHSLTQARTHTHTGPCFAHVQNPRHKSSQKHRKVCDRKVY